MDDYEHEDSGLGALAAWQLGRWSAEGQRSRLAFLDNMTGRSPVSRADYNHACNLNAQLVEANHRHVADLANLRAHVEQWRVAYEQLKERTLKAERDLKLREDQIISLEKKHGHHLAYLERDIIYYMKAYRKATGTTGQEVV